MKYGRTYNFSAGPSAMPLEALETAFYIYTEALETLAR